MRIKGLMMVVLAMVAAMLSGCATIMPNGGGDQLTFSSEPIGAVVKVDGKQMGTTPCTVNIQKKGGQVATYEKDGYEPTSVSLPTSVNPWFLGNLLIGGLPGSSTDVSSGNVTKYAEHSYHATLTPLGKVSMNSGCPQAQARRYIIAQYANILKEINGTRGEYCEALMKVLKVDKSSEDNTIDGIKDISKIYEDIPTFAAKVVLEIMGEDEKS
jgi:uncharacterized protein YceK